MCGRFVLFTVGERLLSAVAGLPGVASVGAPQGTPDARYNVAPTQTVPVVRLRAAGEGLEALVEPARWGLYPHWKRDEKGPTLFNARAETAATKPSFRSATRGKRCLIPMDGYYEWKDKKPRFVRRDDGRVLWAAGLWDTGLDRLSCTIVTTASAKPIDWLHDRMPRFLDDAEVEAWATGDEDAGRELLHPTPPRVRDRLVATEAASEVGSVANDYPELLGPAAGA